MKNIAVLVAFLVACSPSAPTPEVSSGTLAALADTTIPTPPPPENEPMPVQQVYAARGLYTYPNQLSEVPDGAFSRANDGVIRREGIIETRRGFKPASGSFGSSDARLRALSDFAGTLMGHTTAGVLLRHVGGVWDAYSGTYSAPGEQRMRFLQTAKSLYFTTSAGVYRLDESTGQPMPAGVPQALSGSAALAVPAGAGFLPAGSQTAYRAVWGYRNANNRIILGAPSNRMRLTNPASGSAKDVTLTIPVPSWVTSSHFIQVHRADTSASETIPAGDDMSLVYEVYPSSADRSTGTLSFTDITPDELKSAPLYSSPNAGTPGSDKFQPPVCSDLAEHKGRMWCAATAQRQRLLLTLLSVHATSGGMANGEMLTIYPVDPGVAIEQYTAGATEDATTYTFQRYTSGTASQNVAETAKSLVRVINAQATGSYFALYVSGDYDSPGQIMIEARDLDTPAFAVDGNLGGPYWAPAIPWTVETASMTRAGSTVTVTTTARHSLRVGQDVTFFGDMSVPAFPGGQKVIASTPTSTTFTYTEAGSATTSGVAMLFRTATPIVESDATDEPASIAYSEYQEPDAVPLANYIDVGSANYAVKRIMPLGETLFIFKEEGIYTLNGDSPETFNVQAFPTPAKVVAPDSIVTLGNSIYALTDQGVMVITENGATVISRPIEAELRALFSGESAPTAQVRSLAFGVAYETEREYWLFLPASASDAYATQAYVYNYATRTWVRWTLDATTGYVLPGSDIAYLGAPTTNGALVERKTRTVADYQDADGVPIHLAVTWAVRTGDAPSSYKNWQKATVYLEQPNAPSTILASFTVENGSSTTGWLPTEDLPYVQSYVPEDQCRSQVLMVGAEAGEAGKLLALTGLSVGYTSSGMQLR